MDLKHVNKRKSAQPSIFFALLTLLAVILLPFFLVKTFRDKHHENITNRSLTLPKYQETADNPDDDQRTDNVLSNDNHVEPNSPDPTQLPQIEQPLSPKKTTVTNNFKSEDKWEVVITKKGDTLGSLFSDLGINKHTLHSILHNNPHQKALTAIKPGQKLQFALHKDILDKVIIPFTLTQSIIITRVDDHYVTKINSREVSSHNHYVTATVQGSLYNTAKRMGISYKLIQQMADIFNWEIDFSKDVRAGDRFTIIYKAFFIENKQVGTGEILAVTYTTTRGKTYRGIRHKNDKNEVDYFNENGLSLKKAFTRYPIKFSHISSTFSLARMYPVLKRKRPHKGIDLAAPIGTPIKAIGDGRITSLGENNGYGNMIKIKHNDKYSTLYAHMLKFQKGLSKGSYVKRGQVIGYVGQTGLATGPHCHYEFHINSQPKNPTTIDLPRASPIATAELSAFKYNAGILLAQMKLFEDAHIASENNGKSATV